MSKPVALKGWAGAFIIVPMLAIISLALLVLASVDHRGKAAAGSQAAKPANPTPEAHKRLQASYAALPLAFEENQGQTDGEVKYMARGRGYTLFLTANDAVFSLYSSPANVQATVGRGVQSQGKNSSVRHSADRSAVVHMQLVGGNSLAKASAEGELSGASNYFIGNDPSKWRRDVPRYGRVSYANVYPGVNLAFHGAERQLEFDFLVAPAADTKPIAFHFTGAKNMKTDNSGNLVVSSAGGDVLLHKPVAYQQQDGVRQAVDARFVLKANHQVGFQLGNYDRSRELVIDPSITTAYSTYLGGSGEDDAFGIAFDSNGNAYVTGKTNSTAFPGATAADYEGGFDVFVTKIAANGSTLGYSTYIGGTSDDSGNAIAVDSSGDAFVAGGTSSSTGFPVTPGAFQTTYTGAVSNAFVCKLNTTGSVTYCTFLGGTDNDVADGIAVDSSGNAYTAGFTSSIDFPVVSPALQTYPGGNHNGFVTEVNSSGSALVYSTYLNLGGATGDSINALALDSNNNVYVTGVASGASFHTTAGVVQPANAGLLDAFVTVINSTGSNYVYSTFLGGTGNDNGDGIAVDSSGNAYVTGSTASTDFPLQSASAVQATYGGSTDAFVAELNPTGTKLIYSTYLGGSGFDQGAGIAVDGSGNAYVTGTTSSSDFPTASATQTTFGGSSDAFVSEIGAGGSSLAFSTYLGGSLSEDNEALGAIAVDSAGANIYVTGNTGSTDFPVTAGVKQGTNGGGIDAFVVKYSQAAAAPSFSLTGTALTPSSVSPGGTATSTITVTAANGFSGSVTLSCAITPAVTAGPTCGAASATPTTAGTLTISTTAASALLRHSPKDHPARIFYAMLLPVAGISLVGVGFGSNRSRRGKLFGFLMIAMVVSALMLMPACGGSSSHGGGGGGGGTPAGMYTIVVSGTATGATQTGTAPSLTLTVN